MRLEGTAYPTFRGTFPAGEVVLGGMFDPGSQLLDRGGYLVLLAEEGGQPTPAPPVPPGQPVPQPNDTCPAWVHDQYVAGGPDGQPYRTWHPQIDPVFWCDFRHDHGSDPSLLAPDYEPLFGYAAAQLGLTEPHEGYKEIVWEYANYRWLAGVHFGAADMGRACRRFHGQELAISELGSGRVVANLHFVGDFGSALSVQTHQGLTPPDCPQQYDPQLHGSRSISTEYTGAQQYEVWLPDYENNVLGIEVPLAFSTRNPMQVCNNLRCDNPISTGFDGAKQAVIVFLDPSDTGWYGFSADGGTGTFYTDPYGQQLVAPDAAGAVRQYVEAGVQATSGFGNSGLGSDYLHTYGPDAWRGLCTIGPFPSDAPKNLEQALRSPN